MCPKQNPSVLLHLDPDLSRAHFECASHRFWDLPQSRKG